MAVLVAVAVLGSGATPAAAHTRSMSYSSWDIGGRTASIRLRLAQLELAQMGFAFVSPGPVRADLAAYVAQHLELEASGKACPLVAPVRAVAAPEEFALLEWDVDCPGEGALTVRSELLLEVAPGHLHFVRIRRPGGKVLERVLSAADPAWTLTPGARAVGSSIGAYVALGVGHIATGIDHVLFLLALLLVARRVGELLSIVTGFTIAHSATLALAALGRIEPEPAAVEALIGGSIALVAAENAWLLSGRGASIPRTVVGAATLAALGAAFGVGNVPVFAWLGVALFSACYFALLRRVSGPVRLRVAIALGFGLIHGFGFAGVLAEIGLPTGRLLPALLGFNLGVELGQLVLVLGVWPLLARLAKRPDARLHRGLIELATACICGVGVYWLVERAYS